jgi:hypothetical protein
MLTNKRQGTRLIKKPCKVQTLKLTFATEGKKRFCNIGTGIAAIVHQDETFFS